MPAPLRPAPSTALCSTHANRPWQRGAYSAWELGMTTDEWEQAHAPLTRGRVSFAGEAWCRTARPYTQGAFLSGIRAVDKWVLPALGMAAGPASPCDRDDQDYYQAYITAQVSALREEHEAIAWFIYPIFAASSVFIVLLLRKIGQRWRQRASTKVKGAAGALPSKKRSAPGLAELILVLSLAVAIEFAYYLPYAMQLQVMAQLHLNNAQFGLIDTVHNIGTVCIVLAPDLADRFEVTRVLGGTALASSVGCLISFVGAWLGSFWLFLLGWAVFGAACNALLVAQDVYLSQYFLDTITLVYALQAVAHGAGTALAFGAVYFLSELPFVWVQFLGACVCTLVVPMTLVVHGRARSRADHDAKVTSLAASDEKSRGNDNDRLKLAQHDGAAEAFAAQASHRWPGVSEDRLKQLLVDYTRPKYRLIYNAQRRFIRLACGVTILSDATIALAFSTVAVQASLLHHGTPSSETQQYLAIAFVLNIVAALAYSLVGDEYRKRCRLLAVVNIVTAVLFLCFLIPAFPPFLFFAILQLCQAVTYSACWALLTLAIRDEGERGYWFTLAAAGQHMSLIVIELLQGFLADATGSFSVTIVLDVVLLVLAAALACAMVRIDTSWGVLNEDLQIRGGVAAGDWEPMRHMHRNIQLAEESPIHGDPEPELVKRLSRESRRGSSMGSLPLSPEKEPPSPPPSPPEEEEEEHEPIHGKGLVTSAKIRKGEIVWFDPASKPEIYANELADDDLVPIADMQNDPSPFHKMVQHFSVQISDTHYEGLEGAKSIEEIDVIVSNDASWFMNHSCDPNCGFSSANSAIMIARRDIEPGEEVTFDYGTQESADFPWYEDGCWECRCGTTRCRGRLRPDDWKRLSDESWYPDDAFAPYLKEKLEGRRQRSRPTEAKLAV